LKNQNPRHQKKQVAQRRNNSPYPAPLPKGPNDPPDPQEVRKDYQKNKSKYKKEKREILHKGGASNGSFLRLPQWLILQESKKAD
jgi:hypothetical protein